jgi:phosphohistidine swiveling domain-containing protein
MSSDEMTFVSNQPVSKPEQGELSAPCWTRRIADEFWSGAVTPLTFSLLAEPMVEHMVRGPLRRAGLGALASAPVFRLYGSHVYVNADLLAEVIGLLPGSLQSEGLLALLPAAAHARLRSASSLSAGARAVGIATQLLLREKAWVPWRRAAAFDAACARLRVTFTGTCHTGPDERPAALHAEIGDVRAHLGDYLAVVSWGIVFAYVFYHLTTELARRWAPALAEERAALTVGLPGVASLDAHRELLELGAQLTGAPAILAAVQEQGPAAGWRLIAADRGALGNAFRAFLTRHGHRLTGRDLLYPSWRDAPEIVVKLAVLGAGIEERAGAMVRCHQDHPAVRPADHGPDGAGVGRHDPDHAAWRRRCATETIEAAIGRGLGGSLRRMVFRAALAGAQRYAVVRENMRYHADYVLARLRDLVTTIGAQLTASGRLAAPLDLCFLTFEEVGRAVDHGDDLRALVAERRAAFERDQITPPLPTLDGDGPSARTPPAAVTTLAGETGSPGHCRARARVVRGPVDFDAVERGDVVVAVYADPGWTPVLELVGGLVLEAGGQLSHGAIVAREFGIPAVVNVSGATGVIRNGDTVELDATAGVVTIIAPA